MAFFYIKAQLCTLASSSLWLNLPLFATPLVSASMPPLNKTITLFHTYETMRPLFWIYGILLCGFFTAIAFWPDGSLPLIQRYGFFFFLGLGGALVASSTGAGGGVIFIPFFAAIGFSSEQSVATSMAIQCFGMTAGSVAWLNTLQKTPSAFSCSIHVIRRMLWLAGPTTAAGVLCGQYFIPKPQWEVAEMFRWFSIFFGIVLFIYTWRNRFLVVEDTHNLHFPGWTAILLVCFSGGIITSWISVGVGECIALLLFFLGFSPALAVAIGVFTSSISVLTGIVHHLLITKAISFEVLLFAGQAALIGGYLARHITRKLGSFYLKLFFATWIFLSGLFMG